MTTPLKSLAEHGQSPWIDYISRDFVRDGDLKGLVDDGIVGVTSNPTIFQGAIADGDAYDDQMRELLDGESDPRRSSWRLPRRTCARLRSAARGLRRGDSTRDGWVSLEVDPNLAHDATATAAEARRLHAMIDRPNLFVKIPGTEAGL